jgi:beta-glucuronidase
VPQTVRGRLAGASLALMLMVPVGCAPRLVHADLAPTLALVDTPTGRVAVQAGIPVPTFERQPRPVLELGGDWRVEHAQLDDEVTLADRSRTLPQLERDAAGRQAPDFDDTAWPSIAIPGPLNPPPERVEDDAWLRRTFDVPAEWADRSVTLKFGAVNYVADVWLNGVYLGYHEGGYTPFAFDAGPALLPGAANVLAVRVANPAWGSRNDIVPWGLADWWNFGGIVRDVWLEAADPVHVARADVMPHLDGADVRIVVASRAEQATDVELRLRIHPALVDDTNLLTASAAALIAPSSRPIAQVTLDQARVEGGGFVRVDHAFSFQDPDWWSPGRPALYVLDVELRRNGAVVDRLVESFGLRTIAVDAGRPRLILNDQPTTFRGVALHDQKVRPSPAGPTTSLHPTDAEIVEQLEHARAVNADLIRAGHTPPDPVLLRLADRLGFAVWTEIPLYHFTPQTFGIALERGIAQQMLREMALRDMNRPSVLFHGLANESTGQEERQAALARLHDVDREIDGTRLTGQAAYGFQPDDISSTPLDVAGYTFYHGVFYGDDPRADSLAALDVVHATYPDKPVMILEFGRWADPPDGERIQREILEETLAAINARDARRVDGFVSAAVWWTLEDYWTMRPSIEIEHFGMFAADGRRRPVGEAAAERFGPREAGLGPVLEIESAGRARSAEVGRQVGGVLLLGYIGFGLAVSLLALLVLLLALTRGPRLPAGRSPR